MFCSPLVVMSWLRGSWLQISEAQVLFSRMTTSALLDISIQRPEPGTLEMQKPRTCAPCRFELDMQLKLRPILRVALERPCPWLTPKVSPSSYLESSLGKTELRLQAAKSTADLDKSHQEMSQRSNGVHGYRTNTARFALLISKGFPRQSLP